MIEAQRIDLSHRVAEFLKARSVPGCEQIRVEAHGGTAVLSGRVPSYQARELSWECCRRVCGVRYVVNELHVG